jgi:uncharacterized protein
MKRLNKKSTGMSGLEKHTGNETLSLGDSSGPEMLADIRKRVEKVFENAAGSHDWDHTLRVYRLCERIGPPEGADMDVLRMAAILHDIGRCRQDRSGGAVCHAEIGADMAKEILADCPLPEHRKANVLHCIASHRFRKGLAPGTVEAKVLFDADKIDAIGAVGVARAYQFAGEIGARLHSPETDITKTRPYSADDTGYREYCVKLSKIKNRLLTPSGKRIAAKRHEFMAEFFDRFLKEVEGKDE